jgi:hypothetical protein
VKLTKFPVTCAFTVASSHAFVRHVLIQDRPAVGKIMILSSGDLRR